MAWRIIQASQRVEALTGEGSHLYGGRWNHKGIPLIYLGGSLALASLEVFVHISSIVPFNQKYFSISARISEDVTIKKIERESLPPNWQEFPAPDTTKDMGTRWAEQKETVLLQVPSVLIPEEVNYLLNPAHPDFRKIKFSEPKPFYFDARMWKSGK
ncbi:MAG: RES domain-containing protein [Nitrospirae bacterium]|nr:RES domain-containing protein [Nitrospirota bacterium]